MNSERKFFFKKSNYKNLPEYLFLFLSVAIPLIIAQFLLEKPQNRYIHIENFRYGKDPSAIYCNRGDTLHITFSSRDTGHSFFLQEFDIDAKIGPGNNQFLKFKASDPQVEPVIEDTLVLIAQHPGILNYFISKSNFRCHVWCGPMHAFEHGKLIIGPNNLLLSGLGFLFGLFGIGIKRFKNGERFFAETKIDTEENAVDILERFPWLRTLIKKSWFQPLIIAVAGLILYIVLLTTIFGTQMSGRNLGVMLIWTVWLFLVISIFTPWGGRIWCLACPLPAAGEFIQRGAITRVRIGSTMGYRNKFFGLNKEWPEKLKNGWPRLFFFLLTGTLSTTFVANPRATGIAILVLIIVSTVMALVWKLRSFCQYICPINTFLSLYGKMGKLALRKSDPQTCAKCKPVFCQKGSNGGWACPYGLNVNEIDTNFDCGMCTECIRSCHYNNVTFKWRNFGSETQIRDTSMAWASMALFVVVCAYTILYLGHWAPIRDYVNILDKANYGLFAIYTVVLWSSALLFFPIVMLGISALSKKIAAIPENTFHILKSLSAALLPLGLFIWLAFIIQMLFTNISFVGQSLSDPFGWGWNLLGLAGTPWVQLLPRFIPWMQVLAVLTGFIYSFRNLRHVLQNITQKRQQAFSGLIPMAVFLWLISSVFIWFYAN
ncbi:MAG: 4Fe-4S binding protein [Calditrichaeota bacterium]|nr:4Fe-4S binding protein [Calditrichota bacterium]